MIIMGIAQRYQRVEAELAARCAFAGRAVEDVRLIAVSKTVGLAGAQDAVSAGALDFGENRPEQIVEKSAAFPQARWHFIGNIQSRRIPEIVEAATLIHSLFQLSHARKIDEAAAKLGKVQDVLVEVNVSGEESKSGIRPEEALDFVLEASKLEHLRVRGFMTMAPQGDASVARECFSGLRELFEEVRSRLDADDAAVFTELSMGMSEDWPEAVAEGATMVRVGRAIFSDDFE